LRCQVSAGAAFFSCNTRALALRVVRGAPRQGKSSQASYPTPALFLAISSLLICLPPEGDKWGRGKVKHQLVHLKVWSMLIASFYETEVWRFLLL
jgi:hypothetical protein